MSVILKIGPCTGGRTSHSRSHSVPVREHKTGPPSLNYTVTSEVQDRKFSSTTVGEGEEKGVTVPDLVGKVRFFTFV